jgi:hypothetical protein
MMVVLVACLAFAVDVGYLYVARAQLQRSADAAAMAAAWELIDQDVVNGGGNSYETIWGARSRAREYASLNLVTNRSPALAVDDIRIGHLANPFNRNAGMSFFDPTRYNAVSVCVRRTANQNGEVPLFFARVLGFDSQSLQAEATACFTKVLRGFRVPSSGGNLGLLPFAIDEETWLGLVNHGIGGDDWSWDSESEQLHPGSDSVREVNLYPQGTGSPGNRGTVDIGSDNNSTNDIARQILEGISPEDLEYLGGKLELNADGKLYLKGDPGISAGMKDELASIKGQPRTILIFREVTGNGNNAVYTIVGFAGICIMDVKLTGNPKRVTIQPAITFNEGGIPSTDETTSYFVYSRVWLAR